MKSADSARLNAKSPSFGGFTEYAMFWFRHEQVQWLSPQMPQIRLVMKCASRGSMPFMKMSKPRNSIDVDQHFSTCWLVKSISVWMPSEPTIRVTGSHDICLTVTFCSLG